MTITESVASVYSSALRGEECAVLEGSGELRPLPVRRWTLVASLSDRRVLAHCSGPTLDLGCGPGRMAQAIAESGQPVLGIDRVPEAVRQTRARGVAALIRDVFGPLPAEGRWGSALLADGNIGIGGDPRALLQRVARLVEPGGRVVVDLDPPGSGVRTGKLRLATATRESRPFSWAAVGADAIGAVAAGTGLIVASVLADGDRWFAVLERGGHRG